MEINDLVDKHLTPDEEGQRLFVITLKKKQGRYVSRENTNVNLINCNVTEFTGNKGYSNISKSDVKFGQELKESEFYIYDSYIDLNGTTLNNCRGEFYNCWITGKVKIDEFSRIKFKCCYFQNSSIEVFGDVLVESKHKGKSKIGYNEKEIPDTDIQFNNGGDIDGKRICFKVEKGSLKLYDVKDGQVDNYFIHSNCNSGQCIVEVYSGGIFNVSGENSDDSVIYVKNSVLRIRQVGALLGGKASCLICDNSIIDIDGIGEVITDTGKACSVNKCSNFVMRNIGKIYPDAGSENINLVESQFEIYNLAFSGYTKTINIDKSSGRIEKIGEFSTNGEAFVLDNGSKVYAKNVGIVKVGKDFMVLRNGSELTIQDIESYVELPKNFCYLESGSKLIAKYIGSLCQVNENFVYAKESDVMIQNGKLSDVSGYLIETAESKIWLREIEGNSTNGIKDNTDDGGGSEIWVSVCDITLSEGILVNSSNGTELYVKDSKITSTSGDLKFEAGNVLEITENSDIKCSKSSALTGMKFIRVSESTIEASGNFDSVVSDECVIEKTAKFKSGGDISFQIADGKILNSQVQAVGNIAFNSSKIIVSNSNLDQASLSFTSSIIKFDKVNISSICSITNSEIVSYWASGESLSLSSVKYSGVKDTWTSGTLDASYLDIFEVVFTGLAVSSSSSIRANNCAFGNVTGNGSLILESLNSSFGTISCASLEGILIGGSSTITCSGKYLLVGSGNSSSSSNAQVLDIGASISSSGNGISIINGKVKMVSSGVYIEVDGTNSKIVLYKSDDVSVDIGSDITITAKGGNVKNVTS